MWRSGNLPRLGALEQAGAVELAQDRADAHRRLHVAALADVVDVVLVVDDQRDRSTRGPIAAAGRRRGGALR